MYLFTETHLFPSPWWGLCSCTPAVLSFPSTLNIDQPFWVVPDQSRVPGATEPVILHQLKIRPDPGPEFTVIEAGSRYKIFLFKTGILKTTDTPKRNGTWQMLSRIYRIYNVHWKNYFQVLINYYRYILRLIHLPHSWDDPGLGCNPNTVRSSLLASACKQANKLCLRFRGHKISWKRKKFHDMKSWIFFLEGWSLFLESGSPAWTGVSYFGSWTTCVCIPLVQRAWT